MLVIQSLKSQQVHYKMLHPTTKEFSINCFFISLNTIIKIFFCATDLCGGATLITSSPSPGTCSREPACRHYLYSHSTLPGRGTANNDVWFKFVAQSTKSTRLHTLRNTLVNGRIQLFSGGCGALTSSVMWNCFHFFSWVTIGVTYFIRIYSTSNANGTFTICVIDPPANDLCANAVSLTSGSSCVNTTGSVVNATYSGGLTDCLGPTPTYDVWYSFVAQTTNPSITVTLGATASGISLFKIQLFSGACGALASIS